MLKEHKQTVGAIMVLFKPDWEVTVKAINALAPQVDELCVVDNTPAADNSSYCSGFPNIHYIPLGENRGIAAAQNVGIQHFIDLGYDFVVFSDQDSTSPENTVSELLKVHNILSENGVKIATVGTRAINKQTGKPYPPKSKEIGSVYDRDAVAIDDLTECYSVISSMSLTSTKSLTAVGGFDESLFIDGVDHEWCWRAWHKASLRSFIAEKAIIYHMLGEGDKSLAGKAISIPSPFRTYYQFRNFIWLYHRASTPKFWKNKNLKKFIIKFFYFPLFVKPRAKYLCNIINGIKDGFKHKQNGSWPNFQQKNA